VDIIEAFGISFPVPPEFRFGSTRFFSLRSRGLIMAAILVKVLKGSEGKKEENWKRSNGNVFSIIVSFYSVSTIVVTVKDDIFFIERASATANLSSLSEFG
jgi:hypothetical protein